MRLILFVYIHLDYSNRPVEFCVYDVIEKRGISKPINNANDWNAAKLIIEGVHDGIRLQNLGEKIYITCASYLEKAYLQETSCPVVCLKDILPRDYGLWFRKYKGTVDPSLKHDKCLTIATMYGNFLEVFNDKVFSAF